MGTLSHLRLRHFRNYTGLDLGVGAGLTVFVGRNGQGKTNLLEAIHYLSLLRSFRTRRISDLRQWDAPYLFVEGQLTESGSAFDSHRLSVAYTDARRLRLNGNVVNKASQFINQLVCIAFVPEDIELVKGAPGVRRRFVDVLLCQLDSTYLAQLMRYALALKSRNAMLRDAGRFDGRAVAAYDSVLAPSACYIMQARRRLCVKLNRHLKALSPVLFGESVKVRLRYGNSLTLVSGDDSGQENAIREMLERDHQRDREHGYTRSGPHRDDIGIQLNMRSAGSYGSEGQCRLISLALRLASVNVLGEDKQRRKLILLVDDVLGELDSERRTCFLKTFARAEQTFLACTDIPDGLPYQPTDVFHVCHGKLKT